MSSIVQNYIHELLGIITSFFYLPDEPVPYDMPLTINQILQHNHNLDRYILKHPKDINDFQLTSLWRMLQCDSGGCGGKTYACPSCSELIFIPFHSIATVACAAVVVGSMLNNGGDHSPNEFWGYPIVTSFGLFQVRYGPSLPRILLSISMICSKPRKR